jgi:hypothetical protein
VGADQVPDTERHRDGQAAEGELAQAERRTGRPVRRPTTIPPLTSAMAVSARDTIRPASPQAADRNISSST